MKGMINFIYNKLNSYIIIVLIILPLMIFPVKILNISLSTIFFLVSSLIYAIKLFVDKIHNTENKYFKFKTFDIFVGLLLLYNVIEIVDQVIKNDIFYEPAIIMIAVSFLYIIITRSQEYRRKYLYYSCCPGIILFFMLLCSYFIDRKKLFLINGIIKDQTVLLSYALFIAFIATILYCTEKNKLLHNFAAVTAVLAFLILFLQNNWVANGLGGLIFILIPLVFIPTAELVKLDMQLALIYFLMLSNVAILHNVKELINLPSYYNLNISIYINVLIAVAGLCFFYYWDRHPKEAELSEIILNKFRKVCRFLLYALCLVFLSIFIMGNRMDYVHVDIIGKESFIKFVKMIQHSYYRIEGTLFSAMKGYGILGVIFFVILFSLIAHWLKKNYDRKSEESAILTLVGILYLIQSIFMKQSILTTPCYLVFVIFAVYKTKPKRKRTTLNGLLEEQHEEILPKPVMDSTAGN